MITAENPDDQLSYCVVVHGVDTHAFERAAVRYNCRRGGIRPTDQSRYISLPVTPDTLGATLAWIKTELAGHYREIYLGVSVQAKLSWSEVIIPAEVASLAGQHNAAIKVLTSHLKSA